MHRKFSNDNSENVGKNIIKTTRSFDTKRTVKEARSRTVFKKQQEFQGLENVHQTLKCTWHEESIECSRRFVLLNEIFPAKAPM